MDVMATAQAIGLVASGSGDVFGTIEEAVVLAALDELATQNATFAGLIAEARARVLTSRSAGIEKVFVNGRMSWVAGATTVHRNGRLVGRRSA